MNDIENNNNNNINRNIIFNKKKHYKIFFNLTQPIYLISHKCFSKYIYTVKLVSCIFQYFILLNGSESLISLYLQ